MEEGGKMYGRRGVALRNWRGLERVSMRCQKLLLLVIPGVEHTSNLDDNGDESER